MSGRQACSVESAARRSGLPVYVVLLSPHLALADNATCSLAMAQHLNVRFFSVNLTNILARTALGKQLAANS